MYLKKHFILMFIYLRKILAQLFGGDILFDVMNFCIFKFLIFDL